MALTQKQAMARCGDCEFCINDNGTMKCSGFVGAPEPIVEIDESEDGLNCPEEIELAEIEEAEKKAKAYKIQHGAKAEESGEKKPRKPRPKDLTKEGLLANICTTIAKLVGNCKIVNPNNEISFDYEGDNYSLKLVKHRKPKK